MNKINHQTNFLQLQNWEYLNVFLFKMIFTQLSIITHSWKKTNENMLTRMYSKRHKCDKVLLRKSCCLDAKQYSGEEYMTGAFFNIFEVL